METDYRRYTKMLGDTPMTVVRGQVHRFLVKTRSSLWPIDSGIEVENIMAFDGRGRYVTQWVQTIKE